MDLRIVLPAAALAALVAATPATAATERVDSSLARLGVPGLALKGPSPTAAVDLALPARYSVAGGWVELAYEGSPLLSERSTLEASVNGRPVTATRVGPGRHTVRIPLPRGRVDGTDQRITLSAQLRLRGEVCPPPDAPGAYLRVSGTSPVRLDATLAEAPLALSALPGALDQRLGATAPTVAIDFHQAPSPASVRAASLALGQVARATGYPGVRTRVGLPGAPVAPDRGGLRIMLTERPGSNAVAVARRADGGIDVRLAGAGSALAGAASALSSSVAVALTGDRATGLRGLPVDDAARAIPKALPVGTASATGLGAVTATAGFRVPEWLELDRGARLQARVGYASPFGGQLRTLVNGVPNDQRRVGTDDAAQFGLNRLLAGVGPQAVRGELVTGDNTLTVAGSLAAGAAGTCLPLDAQGGTGVLPGGSLRISAHARPLDATLAPWPFPMTARRGGRGGTLVLPAQPTAGELAGALESLAEVARWSDEPAQTAVAIAPAQLPAGNLLLVARPNAVPAAVAGALDRPAPAGTLASVRQDDRLVTLAVGEQALAPLRHGVFPGRIAGRVTWVSPSGGVRVLAGADPLARAAVRDDGTPWRWPAALIVLGGALLVMRGLWGAGKALRRRDAAAPASPAPTAGGQPEPPNERLAAWHARHQPPTA